MNDAAAKEAFGNAASFRQLFILYRLIGARFRAVRNGLGALSNESVFKLVIVAGLGLCFWGGLFLLFNEGFAFVNENAYIFREILIQRMLSLFFLTLLVMLAFSNALISFGSLFRTPETAFLFSLPIRYDTTYLYKMLESLAFSSWAFIALGLPLLLAYGIQNRVEWFFYPAVLLYLLPFTIIPAALGALLGLVLTAIVPRHRGKLLGLLICACIVFAFMVIGDILNVRSVRGDSNYVSGLQADVQLILGRLNFTQHIFSPNYWMSEGLLRLGRGGWMGLKAGAIFWSALMASSVFVIALGWFLAGALYESSYGLASTGSRSRRSKSRSFVEWLAGPLIRRSPAVTVMILKDIKTFVRDPVQWSQVLIFFGLLAIYIANLRNFSYPLDRPFYQNLISFLNLGATCLTLATLVSRFVFPLISLEGRRFWILGLVPVTRTRILYAKFLFSFLGALILTESMVLLSNYILDSNAFMMWIQAITAAFLCLGVTGLGVGLGALFPNLQETNPSKIVAGFGGTLTLILSIGLVLITIGIEAFVCHRFLVDDLGIDPATPVGQRFRLAIVGVLTAIGVVSILSALIPLRLGARALERMEF